MNGFARRNIDGVNELCFSHYSGDICLSDDGECGCSGEVIQMMLEILQIEKKVNLLLMVPEDCYQSVSIGVESFLHYKSMYDNIKGNCKIIVSTGFNELNSNQEDSEILIKTYYG